MIDRQVITTSADGTAKVFDLESGANGARFFLKDFGGQISDRNPRSFSFRGTMWTTYHPPNRKNTENHGLKSIKKTGDLLVTSLKFQIVQLKISPESDHF